MRFFRGLEAVFNLCRELRRLQQSPDRNPGRNRYEGRAGPVRRPPPASRDCLREESNTCGSLLAKHLPQGAQALRAAGQPVVAGLVLRQEPGRSSTFATRPAGNDRRAFIVILNRNSRLQSPRHRCRSRRAQSGVGRRRPGVPSRLYGARWGASEDGIPLPGRHVIIECLEFGRKTLERKR